MKTFLRLRIYTGLLVLLLAALLAACGAPQESEGNQDIVVIPTESAGGSGSVLEQLAANSDFALFLGGWNTAGLSQNLQQGGPFTVFAPTNTAFSRINTTTSALDQATLQSLLQHHVVTQALQPDQLATAGILTTAAGAELVVQGGADDIMVEYATVVGDPIQAENGIIYPVDAVLVPPEVGPNQSLWGLLLGDSRFTTLVQMMGGTDAMYDLRFSNEPDAFLAPTNEALANLSLDLSGYARTDPRYNALFAQHIMMPDGWPMDQNFSAADMVARGKVQTGVVADTSGGVVFETVEVTQDGDTIRVGPGTLIETDINATNGMLHVIDAVLIPPELLDAN